MRRALPARFRLGEATGSAKANARVGRLSGIALAVADPDRADHGQAGPWRVSWGLLPAQQQASSLRRAQR